MRASSLASITSAHHRSTFSLVQSLSTSHAHTHTDTAFMIIGGGLTFLTVYAKRHPIYLAGASRGALRLYR